MWAVRQSQPEHVYNFGALTSIGMSWESPELIMDITGTGVLRLLEAVRLVAPLARVVQASSADQFGEGDQLSLDSPFEPRSPYAVAKQAAHDYCQTYRKAYGMHVSTAIQFNAVSPRLREEFFLRKVTKAVARISLGLQDKLEVGDLSPVREIGDAEQVARAYPKIAAKDLPGDWVLGTGVGRSLREIVSIAFDVVNRQYWEHVKESSANYSRPTDVARRSAQGLDSAAAWERLGLSRPGTSFCVIARMVQADLIEAGKEIDR